MQPQELIAFLNKIEPLKSYTRHSYTSDMVPETVAAHSFRLALMALLLVEEFPELDMQKVVNMCLIHDLGESVTGDIPSFSKTGVDEKDEQEAIALLLEMLPPLPLKRFSLLYDEMEASKTQEARLYKALDMMEGVLQHNEAPLSTWLPLEKELNLTYGEKQAEPFPFLKALRALMKENTLTKLQEENV